jgi:hypothetical protein
VEHYPPTPMPEWVLAWEQEPRGSFHPEYRPDPGMGSCPQCGHAPHQTRCTPALTEEAQRRRCTCPGCTKRVR